MAAKTNRIEYDMLPPGECIDYLLPILSYCHGEWLRIHQKHRRAIPEVLHPVPRSPKMALVVELKVVSAGQIAGIEPREYR
jgi:hypothetical protein